MPSDIKFKDHMTILIWLETALTAEWRKFGICPGQPDRWPAHEIAQAWGYVVAAYFLIEQAFKAIVHLNKERVETTHVLHKLFKQLPTEAQDTLQEFYRDFLATFQHDRPFPFETLGSFLENLDGGNKKGSLDWRYFPIEESKSGTIPIVSINIMHEVVYGCLRIIEQIKYTDRDPLAYTHSRRLGWNKNQRDSRGVVANIDVATTNEKRQPQRRIHVMF